VNPYQEMSPMSITPFEQLMKLARVATGVGLGNDCTYEVSVSYFGGEPSLTVTVHRPPEGLVAEAIVRYGASTEGWRDCASSWNPDNVYRTWEFSPEKGMTFRIFENPPKGKLLADLPYEETREAILKRRKGMAA
jgi:hypothetical protein